MTCSEFTEFLDRFLEGDLSPAEKAEFERHLAACEMCVNYLETYRRAVEMGKKVFADPGDDVPREVPEDLVRAILAARRR
jgi:anti-sigma factor RsiW